jgi:hypothetical protein
LFDWLFENSLVYTGVSFFFFVEASAHLFLSTVLGFRKAMSTNQFIRGATFSILHAITQHLLFHAMFLPDFHKV